MSPAVLVALVGIVLVVLGAALLVQPSRWALSIARSDREAMQALGGAVRVLMGLALVYGAKGTAYPGGVHAFGLALVMIGVVTLWVEPARFGSWLDRWLAGSLVWRLRIGGVLAAIIGVFLLVAALV